MQIYIWCFLGIIQHDKGLVSYSGLSFIIDPCDTKDEESLYELNPVTSSRECSYIGWDICVSHWKQTAAWFNGSH